jgi:hypothetical protein
MEEIPEDVTPKIIKGAIQKLNTWKGLKPVRTLLKNYTDGTKSTLETTVFLKELLKDIDSLNLVTSTGIQRTSLRISLSGLLLLLAFPDESK